MKTKSLAFVLLALLCLLIPCALGQQYNAVINLTDSTISSIPYTNRSLRIYPLSTPTVYSPSVVLRAPTFTNTDNTGTAIIPGQIQGLYKVLVMAPPFQEVFTYWINSNTPSTFSVSTNLVADSTSTFPAGTVAWAAAVSDLRYAPFGTFGFWGTNAGQIYPIFPLIVSNLSGFSGPHYSPIVWIDLAHTQTNQWVFDPVSLDWFYNGTIEKLVSTNQTSWGSTNQMPITWVDGTGSMFPNHNAWTWTGSRWKFDGPLEFQGPLKMDTGIALAPSYTINGDGSGMSNVNFTANTVLYANSGLFPVGLAGGGANTFLAGTTPPSYTSIPDAALSANVVLLTGNQTITGNKVFTGGVTISGGSLSVGSTANSFNTNNLTQYGLLRLGTNTLAPGATAQEAWETCWWVIGPYRVVLQADGSKNWISTNLATTYLFTNNVPVTTSSKLVDAPHNLGFTPQVWAVLLCTNQDSNTGYVYGDEIPYYAVTRQITANSGAFLASTANPTNVVISTANFGPYVINRNGGAPAPPSANANFIIKVYLRP